MTRRIDSDLRSAISQLEGLVLLEPTIDEVLIKALAPLMKLLKCGYGYAFRCQSTDEPNHIPWQFSGALENDGKQIRGVHTLSTSTEIPANILQDITIGRCWYHNDISELEAPLPADHPPMSNMFAVPLVDAKNIYGVLMVGNSEYPFDQNTIQRMRPYIAAVNCLLRATIKRDRFQTLSNINRLTQSLPNYLPQMLNSMFDAILVVDENDAIVMGNHSAASLFNSRISQLIGQPLSTFLPSGAPKTTTNGKTNSKLEQHASPKTVWRGVRINTVDFKKQLVDLRMFEISDQQKKLRLLIMDDISEKIESKANYHSTLQRFQVLTNLAPVGILQINNKWECTYANDTWCRFCQTTPEESLRAGWLKSLHHSDADEILAQLRAQTLQDGTYSGEFRLITPLGHITWVQANACALYNEVGDIDGLIMTFNDITQHLNNEKHLKDIAERDQLTGLINRTFFNDRVETALKGVTRFGSAALMFIDLDEFKHINDTLGHDIGDSLLVEVAERLRRNVRNVDTIARIGGDEFTILLTNVQNLRSITVVADKLIEAFRTPFTLGQRPMYISASIGIAVAEESDTEVKQLLKQADIALYKAKEAGRNQYKFYTREQDVDADLHIHLRQSLKDTSRNDFRVVYQPQVNAQTGKIIGVEALTRWQHSDAKPTGPDKFIKMIEESGLINEFSDWLLDHVFHAFDQWRKAASAFREISLSINLSAKQFRSKTLAREIELCAKKYCIPADQVVLEVTETALIDDTELANNTLKQLRKAGFKLSLDDFGTGYSSLAYLRSMPFNYIKIDKSFIKNVAKQEDDAKIVAAILNLTETLKMDVVAEGVDNQEVSQWLLDNQCAVHQGFHYHKPLEGEQLERLLAKEYAA